MGYKEIFFEEAYNASHQDDWSLLSVVKNQSPIMKLWFLIMAVNLVLVLLLI